MSGIDLILTPKTCELPLGSSYFWDAPRLPSSELYPMIIDDAGDVYPMQFVCQINCSELPSNKWLPKQGMLYFFGEIDYFLGYDVKQPYGLGEWPEDAFKVIYSDVTPEQLVRTNPFEEDDMIPPHAITFSMGAETDMNFRLLGKPYEEEVEQSFDNNWVQLLQLDSDANAYFDLRFYDTGFFYLMIEKKRLLQGDFSHVRPYMTSL